jgi:D-glycero-alpha-D-manno-heptose-7-phosphate kinase
MIITSSPLRISLGGGGTDLPSYYREHGGFVLSAAINRYVYITLHETFGDDLIIKYSEMERAGTIGDVRHPLIRESLRLVGLPGPGLEITSMSDIPAGTGLGSSGSFTTSLLYALHLLNRKGITKRDLAEMACHIEIDILGEPVGKQDQYIAAFGGLMCFEFAPDGSVTVQPLQTSREALSNLEDNLVLFFTGYSRSASGILRDQDNRSRQKDPAMIDNLHFVKQMGRDSKAALESGNLRDFAEIMHIHWEHKKKRSTGMSNGCIDEYYRHARANGALGGKLIGAGGGGFLMFYSEDKTRLRRAMIEAGLREVRFHFDVEGTRVVTQSQT